MMEMDKNNLQKDIEMNGRVKNRYFFYIYRYGHYIHDKSKDNVIYKLLDYLVRLIYRYSINKNNHIPLETNIGGGLRLPHLMGIVISGDAVIGRNCTIFHEVTIGINEIKSTEAPIIGDNVFIGAGAKIIGKVQVGSNSRIGANAVITKDVPEGATVVGVNKIINSK